MGSLSLTFVAAFPTFTAAHFSLIPSVRGAVAQLGERLNGIQEVEGSIPFGSTKFLNQLQLANLYCGEFAYSLTPCCVAPQK